LSITVIAPQQADSKNATRSQMLKVVEI